MIHVSCQTELNLTESKILPDFQNNQIRLVSGIQGNISAQPNPARFDKKTETNSLAGAVISWIVKLVAYNSKRTIQICETRNFSKVQAYQKFATSTICKTNFSLCEILSGKKNIWRKSNLLSLLIIAIPVYKKFYKYVFKGRKWITLLYPIR